MRKLFLFLLASSLVNSLFAQPDRWQQKIKYNINVNMDVVTNRFSGTEKIEYINNSPDTLNKIFIHLYWNAFQPNSSMDVRSRELGKNTLTNRRGDQVKDWDGRVQDRISKLTPDEIGYQKVKSLKVNGKEQQLLEHETILEVRLDKGLLPKSKTMIDLDFEAQVPKQIRRSGRDNAEGIRYSMSQWYPKLVEYDYQGWNANPYIAREFYGVWGDFDVKISIDKSYMIAATGVLQNANQIGFGFETPGTKVPTNNGKTNTWNFTGSNIHDFVWAADPTFKHLSKKTSSGVMLHVFYKPTDAKGDSAWSNVLWAAEQVLPYIEKRFGKYPYPQYSFIQGGDGGMEYAMATLLKGPGLGTVIHEWMHSWYQQIMGTNESLFPWMDEGFTDYATGEVSPFTSDAAKTGILRMNELNKSRLPAKQSGSYESYFNLAKSGLEEPMSTHSDHYNTNYAYSSAAYSKGSTFIGQLGYIVSDSVRDKIMLNYYDQWHFKHPNVNDFIRVAEKTSGLALQWYKEYFVNSTKTIDYAVGDISLNGSNTSITIKRIGKMPMPIDVLLTFKDGSKELHYIPLDLMFGEKPDESAGITRTVHKEWHWTHPEYQVETTRNIKDLKSIEIDPSQRMADLNKSNNKLVIPD
jgi:Peptidase family M1 domain